MIIDRPEITREAFEHGTGWELKPEGACLGDVCIPLPDAAASSATVDATALAEHMQLPVVHDEAAGLWAIGPHSIGARTLTSAAAPELRLPDMHGNEFDLASLRGRKVLLWAWAPY